MTVRDLAVRMNFTLPPAIADALRTQIPARGRSRFVAEAIVERLGNDPALLALLDSDQADAMPGTSESGASPALSDRHATEIDPAPERAGPLRRWLDGLARPRPRDEPAAESGLASRGMRD